MFPQHSDRSQMDRDRVFLRQSRPTRWLGQGLTPLLAGFFGRSSEARALHHRAVQNDLSLPVGNRSGVVVCRLWFMK